MYVIFEAPILDVNLRCASLCFKLFIQSVGTVFIYVILDNLRAFHVKSSVVKCILSIILFQSLIDLMADCSPQICDVFGVVGYIGKGSVLIFG